MSVTKEELQKQIEEAEANLAAEFEMEVIDDIMIWTIERQIEEYKNELGLLS